MLSENIHLLVNHTNVLIRKISTSNHISLSQYFTLSNIDSDGTSMSELSFRLGLDNSTMTRNINILLKRSLVTKNASISDKREQLISLSKQGNALISKLDDEFNTLFNHMALDIDVSIKEKFIDFIQQLNWKMSCHINEL